MAEFIVRNEFTFIWYENDKVAEWRLQPHNEWWTDPDDRCLQYKCTKDGKPKAENLREKCKCADVRDLLKVCN